MACQSWGFLGVFWGFYPLWARGWGWWGQLLQFPNVGGEANHIINKKNWVKFSWAEMG